MQSGITFGSNVATLYPVVEIVRQNWGGGGRSVSGVRTFANIERRSTCLFMPADVFLGLRKVYEGANIFMLLLVDAKRKG